MIVNEDGFTDHNLRKAGYEANPLEDGTLDDYQVFRVPMTSMTVRATEGIEGITAARRRALEEPLRARPRLVDVRPPHRASRADWIEKKFADKPADPRRQPGGLPRRLQLRRDGRAARRCTTRSRPAPAPSPAPTATSTAPRATGARADRRQRPERACRCSSPATRSRPPPSCSTSSRATSASACARCRPRTRSPPPTWRSAPPSAASLGVTATSGPGMDLKAETIGLAVALELPLVVDRRPARRPLDRHAHQDRGRRPADGDLRPPRRVAAAGRRRLTRRRSASTPPSRRRGSR